MNAQTQDLKPICWNDAEILAVAGTSPESIKTLLSRNSQPIPTDAAIYQWGSRGKIPHQWRAKLIYALMFEKKLEPARLFKRQRAVIP
jgi:hypothetical protein